MTLRSAAPAVSAPNTLQKATIGLLVLFLVVFPKGGIKVGGVPLTWGYLALAPLFLTFPLALWARRDWKVARKRLLVLAALLPFQLVSWLSLVTNGVGDVGFGISFVVTFFFIPLMFVLVLGVHLDRIELGFLFRLLRVALPLVAAYGIFLFVYKIATGNFVEIPYLTVNASDVGNLESKHIDRGGIFKLISTYNNGNLYGVSLLLLLPLYTWIDRSAVRVAIVKTSLLLSLSRTVWIGLVLYEVLHRLYVKRPSLRRLAVLAVSLAVVLGGVLFALDLLGRDVSFLWDRRLGGRQENWRYLDETSILPSVRFDTILEMIYFSILHNFGVVGLVAFVLGMFFPVALHLLRCVPFHATEYKRSVAAGLMIYLVVAMSDGGLLYIPVMAFYWFLVSLLVSDNPSFEGMAAEAAPARGRVRRIRLDSIRLAPAAPAAGR
jgi:hypothetical protein